MRIVVINGSPKGKAGNTNIVVEAFLKGAEAAGAETVNLFLAEKEIQHCKGCHVCWQRGPGQCVTNDGMSEILSHAGRANIIVFATPVYFENISGMLKVFMDRMTMIGSPHTQQPANSEVAPVSAHPQAPKLMMISTCGFADRAEFQVLSHWINRVALKMRMELIAEIYTTQGKLLSDSSEEMQAHVSKYLQHIEAAGKEVAKNMKISDGTMKILEQGIQMN
ncbi:MAG: NADPH-dependent reductase [Clostridia bacterium]|jgi:multimeric flavodoxin WrbA|nr:NADPH-dependent reductase [Clostridia bacterium]